MSKKSGTVIKIVAFAAGVAAVGAACYVYRDKIKEFAEKNDVKGKVKNAKNFVTDKLQKNKENDDFDDAEFFDDLESEDTSSRGYTSITITSDEDSPADKAKELKDAIVDKAEDLKDAAADKAKDLKDTVTDKAKDLKDAVTDKTEDLKDAVTDKTEDLKDAVTEKTEAAKDTIKETAKNVKSKAENIKEAITEEVPEEYEYEGLSDVSEDEDALAEEAALDGV